MPAGMLPGSTLGLWVVAVAAIVACYLLARRQFSRMEIRVDQGRK